MLKGVHIWRAGLDDPGWPSAQGLPPAERERAAAFVRDDDARRWVASRWALRRVLGGYLGRAPASVELEIDEGGKPRLPDGEGPEFNLSHSQGLALVAVADVPVGVDVEAIRPGRDLLALAERALPPEEAAAVRAAAPSARTSLFYAAWARHEARLKCLGVGLGAAPARMRVAVEDLGLAPGYAAAVAVAGEKTGPLRCRTLRA